jgi:aminopeptidase
MRILPPVDKQALDRLAALAVGFSANVQPGQILTIEAETGMEPIVRAVAEAAYKQGARFVEPVYYDPYVKRARLLNADEETLDFVPKWLGDRLLALGDEHAARIVFVPRVSPGVLDGVDPKRAGRDQLPDLKERLEVINKRLINWTILPYPTQPWAELVHPDLDADAALAKLTEELTYVCRLDLEDPVAAWRERNESLHSAAKRLTERKFDAIRLHGPGTDLTVGLLPTSIWEGGTTSTVVVVPPSQIDVGSRPTVRSVPGPCSRIASNLRSVSRFAAECSDSFRSRHAATGSSRSSRHT